MMIGKFKALVYVGLIIGIGMPTAAQNFIPVNRDLTFSAKSFGYQAIGINPANIGLYNREDQRATFGLMDITGTLQSSIIKRTHLHGQVLEFSQRENIEPITKDNISGLDVFRDDVKVNLDITYFGFSLKTKKAGSFAFNAKSNISGGAVLNELGSDVVVDEWQRIYAIDTVVGLIREQLDDDNKFTSEEVLQLLNNTRIKMSVTHEFNLNYSKKLLEKKKWKLYGGVGFKMILTQYDMGFSINNGEVAGYMTDIKYIPEDAINEIVNLPADNGGSKLGTGYGFDVGFTIDYNDKIRISMSAVDLGKMNWPVTPFTLNDRITDASSYQDLVDLNNLEHEGIFYYEGDNNATEMLPAKMITGITYSPHKYIDFYADFIAPLNDSPRNLDKAMVGVGTQLSLFDWVLVRTGVTINDGRTPEKVSVPMQINFVLGKNTAFEIGIGTGDLLGFFNPDRPTISANTALMRFHF